MDIIFTYPVRSNLSHRGVLCIPAGWGWGSLRSFAAGYDSKGAEFLPFPWGIADLCSHSGGDH